jgi:hypothetical protein
LGDFADVEELEKSPATKDADLVEAILSVKNELHNNYQDFQAFLDHGGRIGLQHDPLLYGAYTLNPFLVSVELVPMLVVNQGEVAVVKAYVGLATEDTSGAEFKFGSCGPAIAASGRSHCAPGNTRSIRAATAWKSCRPSSSR